MKKLLNSAIVGIGMFLSGNAIAHPSVLNLKMFDNGAFTVTLDGQRMCEPRPGFSTEIFPGRHRLEITRMFVDPFWGVMHPKIIFCDIIMIPCDSKVFAQIGCENQYQVLCVEPLCGNPYGGGYGGGHGHGHGHGHGNGNGYGYGQNTGYYGDDEGGGHGWDPTPDNGYGGGCGPMCMTPEMFGQLKGSVGSKAFESSKMEVVKQALNGNYLSSAQVADLMRMMTFESTKLELAEYAYTHTVDRQNYYLVNNSFTFESSIGELDNYIKNL